MPTRKPKEKGGAAGSRGKTSRARALPSKPSRRSLPQRSSPTRKRTPARATKKVGTKRAGAKHTKGTSTKARAGKQTVTGKAGAGIAQAVTPVRKALAGAATGAAKGAVSGALHGRDDRRHPRSLSRWNRQPTDER
jgi:hypothetical protein